MKTSRLICVVMCVVLILAGCNMPQTNTDTQPPGFEFTAAAQTVQAELTRVAQTQSPPLQASPTVYIQPTTPLPPTSIATSTRVSTNTATPLPCNMASFVQDITVPDGTSFSPGQAFTKTWRLRNAGTCAWTSGYQLVFHQGASLGVPSGYAQSLTSGVVAPGQTIDISVNLIAPMTAGTYRGYWRLREPGGLFFGLTNGASFFVDIRVTTAASHSVTLTALASESGSTRQDGHFTTTEFLAGDSTANQGLQLLLSFDITSIPINATITEVRAVFSGYDPIHGAPFTTLHCMGLYPQDYGTVDGGDFFAGVVGPTYITWCSSTDLDTVQVDNDLKIHIQARLGTSRIQVRLQFKDMFSDMNGTADAVRYLATNLPDLVILYTTP